MTTVPFLQGKTINLRGLTTEDAMGKYSTWFNDAGVCTYNAHHVFPYSRESALKYITETAYSEKILVLAIITNDDAAEHIGNVSLQNIDYISRTAEFAIIIGEKDYWGKGIATEASRLILKHGFDTLNLNRVYCGTSIHNTAMQKLALSFHMKEEGRRREAIYKNGEYIDIIEYGLLKSEFELE